MSEYSFRVRCKLPRYQAVGIEESTCVLASTRAGIQIVLSALPKEKLISAVRAVVLRGDGWPSEAEARTAGQRYMDALMVTFARVGVGADFGGFSPPSGFSLAGLKWMESVANQRVLQDVHGLMVFESTPSPRFASISAHPTFTENGDRFVTVFKQAVAHERTLNDRERLAFDLYNASFFETSTDARFLAVVTAYESILSPPLRTGTTLKHVEELIRQTEESGALQQPERESLLGSLRWLRHESITRTGCCAAARELDQRTYMGKTPAAFFRHCYDLRSRLVHGTTPRPTRAEINAALTEFQKFMADILCGPQLPSELISS